MTDCLTCPPDDQSYAAIALQLQATAQQAESCLYPLHQRLRGALNLPTLVIQLTASNPVPSTPSDDDGVAPIVGTESVLFSNLVDAGQFGTGFEPGLWHVGGTFTFTATGAVTANSFRRLIASVRDGATATVGPEKFADSVVVFEPNVGTGVDINISTVLPVETGDRVVLALRHNNASTLQASSTSRMWATRISSRTSISVVV